MESAVDIVNGITFWAHGVGVSVDYVDKANIRFFKKGDVYLTSFPKVLSGELPTGFLGYQQGFLWVTAPKPPKGALKDKKPYYLNRNSNNFSSLLSEVKSTILSSVNKILVVWSV